MSPYSTPDSKQQHHTLIDFPRGAMAYHLERSLFLPHSREEVFAFFSDAGNLERITPPFLQFRILTPRPIAMTPGTIIDYKLRLYGIPFHWRTLIETFDPPVSFSDVQVTGPYRRWHHLHQFVEVPGGTEMRDHVDYELRFRLFAPIIHPLFVRRSVQHIFDYRNKIISEIFGVPAPAPSG
jgi:ligand-binding SRPBCC domain-containing protein